VTNTADRTAELPGTLDDAAVVALTNWVRRQDLGADVTDVEPLAGGTQNVVVRLRVDGRPMVLRRPPPHPRPNSNRTMLREIAVLRTLAGSGVPHPGFVAGCDLDVRALHQHVFADVYQWAGRLRVTELRRGETVFARQADLAEAVAELEARARALPGQRQAGDTARLAFEFARWYADYNQVHPFREGTGRTGTLLLHTLAALCGHRLDLTDISRSQWYAASRDSMPYRRAGAANHRPFPPPFLKGLSVAE
jgi:aminoglycoside phosphotransferase (APT) family kinase protein